jgi:polysaccharide export outer membrane protein
MRIALLFLLAAAGWAQMQSPPMNNVGDANLPAQVIGVNDLVAVSVYRSPELTRTVRVGGDGAIALPLLKSRLRASGLMPSDLAIEIARALMDEGLLVNPIVEVTAAEYASRPISVMGAVRKPLTFQAIGHVTLLDALARAEGLAPEAGNELLVSLPHVAAVNGQPMVRRIAVKELIDSAKPELNLILQGGEEIRVPAVGRVFVVGNVKKPGAYALHPEDATVMKIIAIAEGLSSYYRKQAYIYREDSDTGTKQEIEVELAHILRREAPDVLLEINDVLYIPDNSGKRTRDQVLEKAITFGAATVSGMLIWNRY